MSSKTHTATLWDIEGAVPLSARILSGRRTRLLTQLDSWMPYRLWVPAVAGLVVFLACIILDVPDKAQRTAQYNVRRPLFIRCAVCVTLLNAGYYATRLRGC